MSEAATRKLAEAKAVLGRAAQGVDLLELVTAPGFEKVTVLHFRPIVERNSRLYISFDSRFHLNRKNEDRKKWEEPGERLEFDTKGGSTEVYIYRRHDDESVELAASGAASCSPLDNFNRRLGIRIALGRALVEFREGLKAA